MDNLRKISYQNQSNASYTLLHLEDIVHEKYGWFPDKLLPLWCFQFHEVSRVGKSWFQHIRFPYLAIEMVLEGEMKFKEGRRSVSVLPGELYIIPPESITSGVVVDNCAAARTLTLLFDGGILRGLAGNLGLTSSTVIHPDDPEKTAKKIRSIGNLFKQQDDESLLNNQLQSFDLLLNIAGAIKDTDRGSSIRDVMDDFVRDPGQKYNVADLAKQANCSVVTLHKYFLQNLGQSPGTWMREHRLNYAAKLLSQKNMMIKECACLCGFDNVQSFSHAFKRYFDLTPNEFIRQLK